MDSALKDIINAATARGNKYVKGEAALEQLPQKMAELGVLLLEKSRRLSRHDSDAVKQDLIEIQNKLDDLRKSIFTNKISIKK